MFYHKIHTQSGHDVMFSVARPILTLEYGNPYEILIHYRSHNLQFKPFGHLFLLTWGVLRSGDRKRSQAWTATTTHHGLVHCLMKYYQSTLPFVRRTEKMVPWLHGNMQTEDRNLVEKIGLFQCDDNKFSAFGISTWKKRLHKITPHARLEFNPPTPTVPKVLV